MTEDYSINKLFSLPGKNALITGGSSGLGLMMAKGLLQNGVRVYISSRSREKCDKALAELEKMGDCRAICADVTVAEQRKSLVDKITANEKENGLSILINNAGTNWGAYINGTVIPVDGGSSISKGAKPWH